MNAHFLIQGWECKTLTPRILQIFNIFYFIMIIFIILTHILSDLHHIRIILKVLKLLADKLHVYVNHLC